MRRTEERRRGRGARRGLKGGDLVKTLRGALAHPPVRESVWAAYRTQKSPLLQ